MAHVSRSKIRLVLPCTFGVVASLVLAGLPLSASAATGDITEYAANTASSGPQNIISGPDGNLWLTEQNASQIAKITPSGTFTEYPTPTASSQPNGLDAGPDGNVWFTEFSTNKIGRITPAGVITEFTVPTLNSGPRNLANGPDGNLWFTEFNQGKVASISTSGVITEYPVPSGATSGPRGIIGGSDGKVWFTEFNANKVANIGTSAPNTITEFSVPTASSGPRSIDAGPDGNLWFTEQSASQIGRITTAGVITEFPTVSLHAAPARMAAGPDGNMWFTENGANNVGRILTAGPNTVTEFPIPTPFSAPVGITQGPDHNIWFAENSGNKVGRLSVVLDTTTALVSSENPSVFGDSVTFTATVAPSYAAGNVTFSDGATILGSSAVSAGTATFTTSALSVGSHGITASYGGDGSDNPSTSSPVSQTVNPAVTVSAISPSAAAQGVMNRRVTITGTNFAAGDTPAISGTGATLFSVVVVNSTTITAKLAVTGAAATGTRDVLVNDPSSGTATCSGCLSIDAPPTVVSLSPNSLQTGATKVAVTISGSGFQPGVIKVAITGPGTGVTAKSVTYVSATQLTASVTVAAAATPGSYNIKLTNPDGGTSTCSNCLAVTQGPILISMAPSTVSRGNTYSVVLSGQDFAAGATVKGPLGVTFSNLAVSPDGLTITATMKVSAKAATGSNLVVTVTNPAVVGSGRGSAGCLTIS
jgi:streptogramin lyase